MSTDVTTKLVERESFKIRPAQLADLPELTTLFSEMGFSRLHGLGPQFVRLLHRHIILSDYSVCVVAEYRGEAVGYIAGTTDGSKFARDFILRYGILASFVLLPRIFHPQRFKTVIRCLTYFPEGNFGDQKASGLAFGVRPDAKRQGVGTALWQGLMDAFREHGVRSFTFLTAGEPTEPANAFYQQLGCEFLGLQRFYEDTQASVYRYDIW